MARQTTERKDVRSVARLEEEDRGVVSPCIQAGAAN